MIAFIIYSSSLSLARIRNTPPIMIFMSAYSGSPSMADIGAPISHIIAMSSYNVLSLILHLVYILKHPSALYFS